MSGQLDEFNQGKNTFLKFREENFDSILAVMMHNLFANY